MGEKETATTMGAAGSGAMFNPREYTVERGGESPATASSDAAPGEKSVQWEPHKSPAAAAPEQGPLDTGDGVTGEDSGAALKTRHDTVKNSIGNIR